MVRDLVSRDTMKKYIFVVLVTRADVSEAQDVVYAVRTSEGRVQEVDFNSNSDSTHSDSSFNLIDPSPASSIDPTVHLLRGRSNGHKGREVSTMPVEMVEDGISPLTLLPCVGRVGQVGVCLAGRESMNIIPSCRRRSVLPYSAIEHDWWC